MINTVCRKIAGFVVVLSGVLVAAVVLFNMTGLEAQEKSIPDHGGFTDCQMCHQEKYKMWEASKHNRALASALRIRTADADCFGCHSLEGFAAKLQGNKVDLAQKESFKTITCVACHKPGSRDNPKQLVRVPEKLCIECHTQIRVLEGRGATGVEETRSFHSAVACISCHMPEANHGMKFFSPDDPELPEDRLDTCTRCHKDNNRKMRAKQLTDWRESYKKAMDPIQTDMTAISAALKEKPDLLNADLKAKLETVRANLFILQQDASNGAHNLDFALKIMANASKDIKEIKAAIK